MKTLMLITTFFLFFSELGLANDLGSKHPLVLSSSASIDSYEAFLSLNPEYIRFSDYQLLKLEQDQINENLKLTYLQAQKLYMERKYFQSLRLYQQIIGLRHQHPWNSFSQKIIVMSLLKAHELSHDQTVQKVYLKMAKNTFPQFNFSELTITSETSRLLKKIKPKYQNWVVPSTFSHFNYLLINGQSEAIFPGKNIKVPNQEFLLTLLSNSLYSIQIKMTPLQLKRWSPQAEWINKGSCRYPSLEKTTLSKDHFIFFDEACVFHSGGKKQLHLVKNKVVNKELLKTSPIGNFEGNKNPLQSFNLETKTKATRPHWIKNKWLWIGAGAIATAFIIANGSKKDKKRSPNPTPVPSTPQPPTITEGF